MALQCAMKEAKGPNRRGVQVSDFDVFDTPVSLELRRRCGRSDVAGSSAPPPSAPRVPGCTHANNRQCGDTVLIAGEEVEVQVEGYWTG